MFTVFMSIHPVSVASKDDREAQRGLLPTKWNTVMFYIILFLQLYIVICICRVPCRNHDLFIEGARVA